jgi:hypothetical protein
MTELPSIPLKTITIVHNDMILIVYDLKRSVEPSIIHGQAQAWSGALLHMIAIHAKHGAKQEGWF